MEEAAVRDLKRYKNLSEFFSRRLRTGARPVDKQSTVVRDIYCEKKDLYSRKVVDSLVFIASQIQCFLFTTGVSF